MVSPLNKKIRFQLALEISKPNDLTPDPIDPFVTRWSLQTNIDYLPPYLVFGAK